MSDISSDETLKGTRRNLKIGSTAGSMLFNQLRQRTGFGGDREREAQALKEALGHAARAAGKVRPADRLACPTCCRRSMPGSWPSCSLTPRRWAVRSSSAGWRTNLGQGWRKQFAEFDLEPKAAASLGQVHPRADARRPRAVACKLQYPGHAGYGGSSDLKQAGWLLNMFERYEGSVRTGRIVEELKERIFEELDYFAGVSPDRDVPGDAGERARRPRPRTDPGAVDRPAC